MANTTNYNWATPDNTDLVKDGAAAIRTLGNSIDTTTKALNPETTLGDIAYRSSTSNTNTRLPIGSNGQILGVSAGVPAWINNDQGDITEVQAGTGISVASGTGPIPVVTNTVATAYDAKGDLIVGTGSDTFSKLSVGTNGYTLIADSAQSGGVKWAVDPVADVVTTAGDILYATAADTVTRLGIGTAGQVLKVNSNATAPEWGAAAGGGDLVRITTSSFSSATAASVDSVFSSTYDNYLILLNVETTSGSNAMNLRFRTSGSDNTTSNYGSGWMYQAFGTGGTSGNLGSAAATNLAYIQDITGYPTSNVMTVFNPFAIKNTFASWSTVQGNNYRSTGGLEFKATTSFDGISFICAAGTFGGTISVYGYKKSQEQYENSYA